jgi:hypothetical protein
MRWMSVLVAAGCAGGQGSVPSGPPPDTATGPSDTGPELIEESFVAAAPLAHDILFVVDNSCSMANNQQSLVLSVLPLVDQLNAAALDWRIGVTSTDIDVSGPCVVPGSNPLDGRLSSGLGFRVIDPTTPDPEGVFFEMAFLGTSGSGCEKGLGAAYKAMQVRKGTENADFVRDDAGMHIVVLSDEQDQTEEDSSPVISLNDFKGWMLSKRATKQSVSFSSVVCIAASSDCYSIGTRYLDVTNAIGGLQHGIDLHPYDDVLGAIGHGITTTASPSFPLAQVPAQGSVVVEVNGVDEPDFTVEEEVVVLDTTPLVGTAVVIRYVADSSAR